MNKWLRWVFNIINSKLINQIVSIFILTCIIPVLVILLLSQYFFINTMLDKAESIEKNNLVLVANNIDIMVKSYKNYIYRFLADSELIGKAKEFDESTEENLSYKRFFLIQKMQDSIAYDKSVVCVAFLSSKKNNLVFYDRYNGGYNDRVLWNIENRKYLSAIKKQVEASNDIIACALPNKHEYFDNNIITFAYKIQDLYNRQKLGTLLVTFDLSPIQEACNYPLSNTVENKMAYNMILDDQNYIIVHPDRSYIGKKNDNIYKNTDNSKNPLSPNSDNFLSSEVKLKSVNWSVFSIINKEFLLKEIYQTRNNALLVLFGVMIFYILLLLVFLKKTTLSVNILVECLKRVKKGDLDVQSSVKTRNEIKVISDNFNDMVRKLKYYHEETERQHKEVVEAVEMCRKAEIDAMESQINAHFLYNTLNVINYTAIEAGNRSISVSIKCLANILHYSLNNITKIVTFRDEVDWLKQYLYLQKERFGKVFDYEIIVDDEVNVGKTYKLLMQVFVENAIIHGFYGINEGGKIIVNVKLNSKNLTIIRIEDNGNGITPEKLDQIKLLFKSGVITNTLGIGIRNAYNRIKAYYGNKAKLYVWSKPGKGTKFLIILPKIDT